jgi:Uma2 family endonuclease
MTKTKAGAIDPSVSDFAAKQDGKYDQDDPISEDGRIVSETEYWADYYDHPDFSYEWNNGRLEEKPVSDFAQFRLYVWFLSLLKDFLHVHPIARMIGLETGFRLALPQKTTIRKPDLGVVLNSNPVPLGDKDRSYHGIFDLCIESLSDSSKKAIERDTVDKKEEYAAGGVTEYYILDESQSETAFYHLRRGVYVPLPNSGGVIRSRVLPGFQFRLTDLYHLPEPPEMVDDPVYQDFVSPFLREERIRAEQAESRAEQAESRAEQAESRAEQAEALLLRERESSQRYAAQLRALGIDPETLD